MKPILEIQNIGKKYKLRGQETPYLTIRDAILGKNKKQKADEFWALQNISFDVSPGESIGVIGKNGAGKSTLLKILSKITPPTQGKIISRGRIASLLEVGTGFHSELTGMENIFLNGSILGLRKAEIKQKLDEIIDFSGVEKFIETPLKHYSSGMQLRLAFAVAAHLEPEILIIDEVLAVGDAEFQKKSLGKMEEVTKQGRTVIFVSHNMGAVQNLCQKAVLLSSGKLVNIGDTNKIINQYIENQADYIQNESIQNLIRRNRIKGMTLDVELVDIYLDKKLNDYATNEPILINYTIIARKSVKAFRINATVFNELDEPIGGFFGTDSFSIEEGKQKQIQVKLFNHNLAFGNYTISTSLGTGNASEGMFDFDIVTKILNFSISKIDMNTNQAFSIWNKNWGNVIFNSKAIEIK